MSELTQRELVRYDRQLMMLGKEGQLKLKRARVLIAGIGGLGSPIALYLAAAGIGRLILVDKDVVELSNLNRQVLFESKDIGKPKVLVVQQRLQAFNPEVEVDAVKSEMTPENAFELAEEADILVDGSDNFQMRYALNEAAIRHRLPFIHGAIYGMEGRATTIIPGETACLRCIYPEAPPPEKFPVIGTTPALIGMVQATEVLKLVAERGELLKNRMLIYDGETMEFSEISLKRDPKCPACRHL